MPIKIFVGNVSSAASKEELEELFSQYGNITECSILNNFAFVHMTDEAGATAAINDLHCAMFAGQPLTVERAKSTSKNKPSNVGNGPPRRGRGGIPERVGLTKIFVGNIKDGTGDSDLRALFEAYGGVAEADICGGYGFVHMPKQIEALKAISELKGYSLNGNKLNIELSTTNTQGRSKSSMEDQGYEDDYSDNWGGDFGRSMRLGPLRGRERYDPYKLPPPRKMGLRGFRDGGRLVGSRGSQFGGRLRFPTTRGVGGLMQPPRPNSQGGNDNFARELLDLYLRNPDAFDRYARDPAVQRSLNLNHYEMDGDGDCQLDGLEAADSFGMPPGEYYQNSALNDPSVDTQPVMYPNLPPPGMVNNGMRTSRPSMPRSRYPGPSPTDYTSFE